MRHLHAIGCAVLALVSAAWIAPAAAQSFPSKPVAMVVPYAPGGGPASMLSGGNQQKIVLSKWMAMKPSVLLLDEPTRGLDIKAKRDVHDVVRALAAEGKGVIVSSSEAEEIAALCHRSLVLSQGKLRGELTRHELTDANILRLAT